jgi:glutaminase
MNRRKNQSISKVFTVAKVIEEAGPDAIDISNALGGNPLASRPR